MNDSPKEDRAARLRRMMAANADTLQPRPANIDPNGPSFPLGFAPPPNGEELAESIVPTLISADEHLEAIKADIEGFLIREQSAAETTRAGLHEPIRQEINEVIIDSAEAVQRLGRDAENIIFDELGMIGEDAATFLTANQILIDPSMPPVEDVPQEKIPADMAMPPPAGGNCVNITESPDEELVTGIPISGTRGTGWLRGEIGPFIATLASGEIIQLAWLGTDVPSLEWASGIGVGFIHEINNPQVNGSSFYVRQRFDLETQGLTQNILVNTPGITPVMANLVHIVGGTVPPQVIPVTCPVPGGVGGGGGGPGGGGNGDPPLECPDPEECPEPEECPPIEECDPSEVECFIWLDAETCELYSQPLGLPARDPADIRVGTSADMARVRQLFNQHCEPEERKEEEPPSHDEPPGIQPEAVEACKDLPFALLLGEAGTNALGEYIESIFHNLTEHSGGIFPENPLVKVLLDQVRKIIGGIVDGVAEGESLVNKIYAAMGCLDPRHVGVRATSSLVGFLQQWLGPGFADAMVPLLQQARFMCPGSVPNAADATMAYLGNRINKETWRCWVRANNMLDDDFEKVTQAARSKLGVSELVQLRARGLIQPQEFSTRVRDLGFLDRSDGQELWQISEQIPGTGDLVRFMVRDAADENVVRQFGLDKHFDDKFTGRVKEWADQNRIPTDYMKMIWRAHWSIPSPTQLAEYRRRLSHLSQDDPAHVDDGMIRAALIQQDIAPGWIEQAMAVMTRVLTRVDARRLLERGVINKEEAIHAWTLLGYDRQNAERLVDLANKIATSRAAKHPAVKRYAAGQINESQMKAMMLQDGIGDAFLPVALTRARIESIAARRKLCVAAIRKRFLTGELDIAELNVALTGQGLANDQVGELADGMICERDARGKKASGSVLCQWYEEGLIGTVEFFSRLRNLGWDIDDATRFIRQCELRISRKLSALEEKQLKEQIKNAKANRRESEKMARELEAEHKKFQTETRRMASEQKGRRKLLNKVAEAMAAKTGESLVAAKRNSNIVFRSLNAHALATRDEVLQLMAEAADDIDAQDYQALETITLGLISSRLFPAPFPV